MYTSLVHGYNESWTSRGFTPYGGHLSRESFRFFALDEQ